MFRAVKIKSSAKILLMLILTFLFRKYLLMIAPNNVQVKIEEKTNKAKLKENIMTIKGFSIIGLSKVEKRVRQKMIPFGFDNCSSSPL